MLPFTHEQFLNVFATYNQAIWPARLRLRCLEPSPWPPFFDRAAPLTALSQPSSAYCASDWTWHFTRTVLAGDAPNLQRNVGHGLRRTQFLTCFNVVSVCSLFTQRNGNLPTKRISPSQLLART